MTDFSLANHDYGGTGETSDANERYLPELLKIQDYRIESLNRLVESLSTNIGDLIKEQANLRSLLDDFKRDVSADKVRAIEVIGVFTAVFGFTALEIKIFSLAMTWQQMFAASFTIFAGFTFFVWAIFLIVERWIDKRESRL